MPEILVERQIIATARAAEIDANSSASGYTILKFERTPIDELVRSGAIGPVELSSAHEFSHTFEIITADLHFVTPGQMYRDKQRYVNSREPTRREIEAWERYKDFSNHWSAIRKQTKNPTLAIFVAAVVDQQPLEHIAQDHGLSVYKTRRILINGLRDYARRAGWVHSR